MMTPCPARGAVLNSRGYIKIKHEQFFPRIEETFVISSFKRVKITHLMYVRRLTHKVKKKKIDIQCEHANC